MKSYIFHLLLRTNKILYTKHTKRWIFWFFCNSKNFHPKLIFVSLSILLFLEITFLLTCIAHVLFWQKTLQQCVVVYTYLILLWAMLILKLKNLTRHLNIELRAWWWRWWTHRHSSFLAHSFCSTWILDLITTWFEFQNSWW